MSECTPTGAGPLKLRARDAEDLQTLAACLQDALVPLSDIAYLEPERRFVMVASRFRWESAPRTDAGSARRQPETAGVGSEGDARFEDSDEAGGEPPYERVNCGVCFDKVAGVRFQGLESRRKDQILNLLTLEAAAGAVTLIFSDGAAIRLDISSIHCHLEDLGEPWPTRWRPSHAEDDAAGP